MIEDYEVTEDLTSPQEKEPTPPQKPIKKPKRVWTTRMKICLVVLAAAIAVIGVFGYKTYAHAQYEKKLDLAEKYMDDGKFAQAKLAFEDAAQIEKKNPEPYIKMGKMYYDNGHYDQALKYFETANQRQETSESYNQIADVYDQKGDDKKAEINRKKAESLSNNDSRKSSRKFFGNSGNGGVSGADRAGNTNGNLIYFGTSLDSAYAAGGRMVHAGDWTYYSTENGLFRTDGSKVKRLSDDVYSSLNVYKNKFYVLETDDDEQTVERMDLDAENDKKIYSTSDNNISKVMVYKDKVYVVQLEAAEGDDWQEGGSSFGPTTRVTAMDLDGGNQKKVLSVQNTSGEVSIDGDRIYYFDAKNFVIRDVNLSGGDDQLTLDVKNLNNNGSDTMPSFYVDNQHVYFTAFLNTYIDYNLKTKDKVVFQSDDWTHTYNLGKDPNGKYVYVISYVDPETSSYDTDDDYDSSDESDNYDSDDEIYDEDNSEDDYDYDGYSSSANGLSYTLWRLDADGGDATKLYTSENGVGFVSVNDDGVFVMENDGTIKSISSNGTAKTLAADE